MSFSHSLIAEIKISYLIRTSPVQCKRESIAVVHTAPVMALSAWFCIRSNFPIKEGAIVIRGPQHYFIIGLMKFLQVIIRVVRAQPHLVPAKSVYKTTTTYQITTYKVTTYKITTSIYYSVYKNLNMKNSRSQVVHKRRIIFKYTLTSCLKHI